jgi:hypothetical protein
VSTCVAPNEDRVVITFGENDEDKVIVVVDSEVVTEVEPKT